MAATLAGHTHVDKTTSLPLPRPHPLLAVAGAFCALITAPTFAFIYNTGHDIPPVAMSGGQFWAHWPLQADLPPASRSKV